MKLGLDDKVYGYLYTPPKTPPGGHPPGGEIWKKKNPHLSQWGLPSKVLKCPLVTVL